MLGAPPSLNVGLHIVKENFEEKTLLVFAVVCCQQ